MQTYLIHCQTGGKLLGRALNIFTVLKKVAKEQHFSLSSQLQNLNELFLARLPRFA